jgi:hypothetical protein|tara:strand:+ start:10937 stop:11119 length:183 start_codon:yes stop_codon:yes gene_type:complete
MGILLEEPSILLHRCPDLEIRVDTPKGQTLVTIPDVDQAIKLTLTQAVAFLQREIYRQRQ